MLNLNNLSPQQLLGTVIRLGMVVAAGIHLIFVLACWRQAANAHNEVSTPFGRVLVIINFVNIFVVLGILIASIAIL